MGQSVRLARPLPAYHLSVGGWFKNNRYLLWAAVFMDDVGRRSWPDRAAIVAIL
jgi:hypothetical protein